MIEMEESPLGGGVVRLAARARFELVPTKTVEDQLSFLPTGATVTVTVSPRRGPEPTLRLCETLASSGFRAVPHLGARQILGRSHLAEIAERLKAAGIGEIFVVGGDPPEPAGPFDSAHSLLVALTEMGHGFEDVGVAGYPERHPLIDDDTLLRELLDKQVFSTYLVTQICYDPPAVFSWIARIRRAGVRLPVYIGIPGAVSRAKLLEISLQVGVGDSVGYLRRHGGLTARLIRRNGWRPEAFVEGVSSLLEDQAGDVVGFHINTFNQVEGTERWRQRLLARNGLEELPAS